MACNVILVNGPPRAGKDTLVSMMMQHYADRGHHVAAFSSIDPIREMLAHVEIDVTQKTEADRKLLAEIGDLVEQHSEHRTRFCYNKIALIAHLFSRKSPVVFLHMREPELINKLEDMLRAINIRLWRVFVDSPRAEKVTSNSADAGVYQMKNNFHLDNDGSLEDLAHKAQSLVNLTCMRKEFARVG